MGKHSQPQTTVTRQPFTLWRLTMSPIVKFMADREIKNNVLLFCYCLIMKCVIALILSTTTEHPTSFILFFFQRKSPNLITKFKMSPNYKISKLTAISEEKDFENIIETFKTVSAHDRPSRTHSSILFLSPIFERVVYSFQYWNISVCITYTQHEVYTVKTVVCVCV